VDDAAGAGAGVDEGMMEMNPEAVEAGMG